MPITALYAGALGLLFVVLSIRVIAVRREVRVALGDGGHATLQRRMRVHGNFAEYAPLGLILLGLAESLRTDVRLLHVIGIALLAGRVAHAIGVSQMRERFAIRVTGMMGTFAALVTAAGACLFGAIRNGALW